MRKSTRLYIIIFISFLMSLLSVLGLRHYYKILLNNEIKLLSNIILSIIVFIALMAANMYILRHLSKRLTVFSAVGGLLASVNMILGAMLRAYDAIAIGFVCILAIIALAILFFSIISLTLIIFPSISERFLVNHNRNLDSGIKLNSVPCFFIIWAIIIVCWLPALLAFHPGIYAYDAISQLDEVLSGNLTSHHPLLHNMYLYITFYIGKNLLGSYQSRMLLYSITQMALLSGSMAYACHCIARWCPIKIITVLCVAVFALNPLFALMSITATKDVLFSAFFLLVICFIIDFSINPTLLKSKMYMIFYMVFMILNCLYRNTGIVICIGIIPIALIVSGKQWISLVSISTVCIAVVIFVNGPIQGALGIEKGDSREALCVPIQQLARVYNKSPHSFTGDEHDYLLTLIGKESLVSYNPRNADNTKNNFNTGVVGDDPIKFLRLWVSIGTKCPRIYLESYLTNTIGFWYPDIPYNDQQSGQSYLETENKHWDGYINIELDSKWPELIEVYKSVAIDTKHEDYPVLSAFFNSGVMFYLLMMCILTMWYSKRHFLLPAPILTLLLWLTLTISPLALVRYALPLFLVIPVFLSLVLFPPVNKISLAT